VPDGQQGVNGGLDATLSIANQMLRDGLDGCTFVKTALKFANDPDSFGPTGSLQRKELKRYADRCNP
jgi:hypothetical protein